MSNGNGNYLFYLAEDEDEISESCKSKTEAFKNFEVIYKRKPDRIIGILEITAIGMRGNIVWENMDFVM
jgi:hypothetical protein